MGENRLLDAAQEAQVRKVIADKMPDQLKMPYALWTRAAVAQLIEQRFGIRLQVRTMGKYLARWGFTPQKPMKKAYEQSPAAVKKWLDEDYPVIAARAKAEGAEIHWGDESGLRSDDVRGRSFAPKGQTPVVRVNNKRHGLSVISTVTNKGQMRWSIFDGALNTTILIDFLRRLIKGQTRKLFLILDNLRVHHARQVKAWLQLKRAKMLEWFANRTAALVVMEACGGAHDWGRALMELGHEVRLISPRKVRPFVQRNKTDAADAQAIWTACQQPGMRFVPVKSEAQQIVLSLHRLRAQLMKTRIMQTNELRGLLYEFGIVLPEGHAALLKAMPDAMRDAKARLPAMLIDSLDEQLRRVQQLQTDIGLIERRLSQQMREMPACKAVAEIPGVGLLTATAMVASMGAPTAFKDAREFAAWVGLVPRQTGTGGRIRQLGISKRGDAYLRTLLMHGARAVVIRSKDGPTWPWLTALLQRRPYCVAVAAVANKLARTIWAVLARGQAWRPEAWQVMH